MAPLAFVRKMKAFNEGVASVQKKEPQGGLSKYSVRVNSSSSPSHTHIFSRSQCSPPLCKLASVSCSLRPSCSISRASSTRSWMQSPQLCCHKSLKSMCCLLYASAANVFTLSPLSASSISIPSSRRASSHSSRFRLRRRSCSLLAAGLTLSITTFKNTQRYVHTHTAPIAHPAHAPLQQSGKRIIYGTTEMLTAHGFLKQLTELHNKSNAK